MNRRWPTKPRQSPSRSPAVEMFRPPGRTGIAVARRERSYVPLPCVFLPPGDSITGPSLSRLRLALRRHRLLYLWYPHPAHVHVRAHESPAKSDLYERLGLTKRDPARRLPLGRWCTHAHWGLARGAAVPPQAAATSSPASWAPRSDRLGPTPIARRDGVVPGRPKPGSPTDSPSELDFTTVWAVTPARRVPVPST